MRIFRSLLIVLSLISTFASAQNFPDKSKTFRLIVPTGAGSSADMLARAYAKSLGDVSGLNVVVDNKPGAETVLGVQTLLAAPRDGYTFMLSSSSTQVLNPVMIPNLAYDPFRDLVPLNGIGTVIVVMNLGPSTTFKTAREFIAAAKAQPGKYTCGSATANARLSCELLQNQAGIKLVNVPYKATAAGITALASGEIDMMFADPGSSAAQWQSGRIRGLAQSGPTRTKSLPNIPTLREEGVPAYEVVAWFAMYFPANVPRETTVAMRDLLKRAAHTKLVEDTLAKASLEPMSLVGDELTALNRKEVAMWTKVVRAANIKPLN